MTAPEDRENHIINGELLAKVFTKLEAKTATGKVSKNRTCPAHAVACCSDMIWETTIGSIGLPGDEEQAFRMGLIVGAVFALDALGVEHNHNQFSVYESVELDS